MLNSNTQQFIKKAFVKHKGLYAYDKVVYINARTKVNIICKKHGIFEQIAGDHLSGKGCVFCARESKIINDFEERARKIHGDKFDYTQVRFTRQKEKVDILCYKHGLFQQRVNEHLSGKGCASCARESRKKPNSEFIESANEIHGNYYLYDKTHYLHSRKKVLITCPKHGDFLQSPDHHLSGKGCPKCKISKGEFHVAEYLNKNFLKYKEQAVFPECISSRGNLLKFDFFIPEKNLAIEYDGEQHFHAIALFGGEKRLIVQKENDGIKNDYCLKEGISLLRIHYSENIENAIENMLNLIKEKSVVYVMYGDIRSF